MLLAVFVVLVFIAMVFVAFWFALSYFILWLEKRQKRKPGDGPPS
jgi:ABC-type amino acid transport system permease subunit